MGPTITATRFRGGLSDEEGAGSLGYVYTGVLAVTEVAVELVTAGRQAPLQAAVKAAIKLPVGLKAVCIAPCAWV